MNRLGLRMAVGINLGLMLGMLSGCESTQRTTGDRPWIAI
jgi:hypothetical protein